MAEKRRGQDCWADGCESTVDDGPLYRVNPKGEPGIFMCQAHAVFVNSWEQRLRGDERDG